MSPVNINSFPVGITGSVDEKDVFFPAILFPSEYTAADGICRASLGGKDYNAYAHVESHARTIADGGESYFEQTGDYIIYIKDSVKNIEIKDTVNDYLIHIAVEIWGAEEAFKDEYLFRNCEYIKEQLEEMTGNENALTEETAADDEKLEESVIRTECNEIIYTNTTSNIRLQPSSSAEKVETVSKGTELLRTAILDNGWSEIQLDETTCYISSKLVDTENIVTETVADTNANESAPVTTTAQASVGKTKTFSNGVTFVARGQTPGGLPIWYLESDNSAWPDYMIAAYDAVGITNDMSDYDKAVAINNYVCSVVDYAYENGVDDRAAYCACLSYGKAICAGYSHAFDALCTMAGVYGNQVVGTLTVNNATHAWNYVLIDGTKYWVDSTLNDSNNNAYLMSTTQFSDHVFGYEK